MTIFSQRLKLQELYFKWCSENGVLDCPASMIVFLEVNGLINDKAVEKYLSEHHIAN